MRLLNRVLALDPDNAQVSARLARIVWAARWKRRARRAAIVAASTAAVAALSWAGMGALRVPARSRGAAEPRAETPRREPPAAPLAAASSTPRPAAPARPPSIAPAPAAAPAAAPGRPAIAAVSPPPRPRSGPTAVVAVYVSPYAQRALLDGIEVARGEGRVAFHLTPGAPHRIQIEHACCFPFVKEFAAGEVIPQPLELKERLRPRPARLRVQGNPQARVYVDGRFAGTAGDSQRSAFEVPVPPGGENPYEAPAELRLERDGYPPLLASVRLRAGAEVTFAAPETSSVAGAPAPSLQSAPDEGRSAGRETTPR